MAGQTKVPKPAKPRDISRYLGDNQADKIFRGGNAGKATKTGRAR
jgi:hypothetical protein